MTIQKESASMRFFRALGWDAVAWPLRRFYCPVKKSDLVLEVGSGGNPYFRANVLCDAYLETQERHFVPLINDRPTVLAYAEKLPFQDDAFDFVIAVHVLEHSDDPAQFISEIQRVGKAGYIEVPDAFMERLCSYKYHRSEITERDGTLMIHKKSGPISDPKLYELIMNKVAPIFGPWVARYPFNFHVRYYWSKADDPIKYHIDNPEYRFTWDVPGPEGTISPPTLLARFKHMVLAVARRTLSQKRRNQRIDLSVLLQCNECGLGTLTITANAAVCQSCHHSYPVIGKGIVNFLPQSSPS